MDIKQVRYFLCLCETLNFSRASQQLGIAQPTLSRAIQRLEAEVGLLLYRDGKDTRLTPLAKALRPDFEAISEAEGRAQQTSRGHSSSCEAEVTIGLAHSFGPKRFDRFLLALIDTLSGLRINTRDVDESDGTAGLLEGSIDVLFSGPTVANMKILSKDLFHEPLLLAMSNTHPLVAKPRITLSDVAPYSFVDLLGCAARKEFLTWARERRVDFEGDIACHREDWVQRIVAESHGVTVLTSSALVTSELTLRPIEDLSAQRAVCMHSIFGSPKSSIIDDIVDMATRFDWEKRH